MAVDELAESVSIVAVRRPILVPFLRSFLVFVSVVKIVSDGFVEFFVRPVVCVGEDRVFDIREATLNVVEPRSVGWRPDECHVGCFVSSPPEDTVRLVGREVI